MIFDVNSLSDIGGKWISVSTAARMLGVSRPRVFYLLRAGRLNAVRFNKQNWLLRSVVEEFPRKGAGRPRYEDTEDAQGDPMVSTGGTHANTGNI